MQCFGQGHRFRSVASLTGDHHVGLRADYHGETGAYQFLIVGDDHANSLLFTHAFHLIGSIAPSALEHTPKKP